MNIIFTPEEDAALSMAISRFGIQAQVGMCMEETGELLSALNKFDRGRVSPDEVLSEIADVIIMMAQLGRVFGDDKLQEALDRKSQKFIKNVTSANSQFGKMANMKKIIR